MTFCSLWGSLIRKIAVSMIKINWEYVYMGVEEFFKQEEERFIRDNLMSDEVLDFIRENTLPFNQLMAYYRCAIMEVETKFNVLNEAFFLKFNRNIFTQRRKTLYNNIKVAYDMSKEQIESVLKNNNLPLTVRAESLTVEQIVKLSNDIYITINK